MNQPSQYHRNTALCGRLSSQNICIIGIITLLLLTATLTISVAAAEEEPDYNLSFFSNGSTRGYTPTEMEFGANIGKSSVMTADMLMSQTRKHMYIQFKEGWPTVAQEKMLGNYSIVLLGSIAGYGTYIASMPASLTPADIPAEAGLRWMGEIPPGDKWGSGSPEAPDRARLEGEVVIIGISMYDDVSLQDALQIRHKYANTSSEYDQYCTYNNNTLSYIFVTEEQNITLIADEDAVEEIGFLPPDPVPTVEQPSQSQDTSTPSASETNESQSVPGFGLVYSLTALILLFYIRGKR
jgi:hypothetical protein